MSLNNAERLDLKRLVDEMECENNTETIRKIKHSVRIRDDIRKFEVLKKSRADLRRTDETAFIELAKVECVFLYDNYTDIFSKVAKDELDLLIMTKLLHILKMIEDGDVDQHEGSVLVGKMLKELYIDSALKRADNLDKENATAVEPKEEGVCISWKEYKKVHLN